MFYQYHWLLTSAESIQLDITVLDLVPDPFYLFLLDLTATLSLTVSGIPRL